MIDEYKVELSTSDFPLSYIRRQAVDRVLRTSACPFIKIRPRKSKSVRRSSKTRRPGILHNTTNMAAKIEKKLTRKTSQAGDSYGRLVSKYAQATKLIHMYLLREETHHDKWKSLGVIDCLGICTFILISPKTGHFGLKGDNTS